jgi:DNA-binding CsgD family transcriptional regulator
MPSQNSRASGESAKPASNRFLSSESRPLTKRELEVVEWIVEGKRNREIGEILGCSSRTVQKHVQHILEKLHLETRTAACTWWHENRVGAPESART